MNGNGMEDMCVCVCVCVCVRACVHACMRVFVSACMHASVCAQALIPDPKASRVQSSAARLMTRPSSTHLCCAGFKLLLKCSVTGNAPQNDGTE